MSSNPKKRKPKPYGSRTYATCKHCGKAFVTFPCDIKRGRAVFCTRLCLFESRREWAQDNARYSRERNGLHSLS